MVLLLMACELAFSTPAEGGTFQLLRLWAGVDTGRWARRHAAPAVFGRFTFFFAALYGS